MNNDGVIGLGLAFIVINSISWLWLAIRFEKSSTEKNLYRETRGQHDSIVEKRIALLEQISVTLPTHHDLNAIRESINLLAQAVAGVRERLLVNTEMTRSIKKHILENEP